MTNKLPKVGKRYKHKESGRITSILDYDISVMIEGKFCDEKIIGFGCLLEDFEEIPEQDLNRSNNTQLEDDHIADVGKKVEEAKDELRDFLNLKEDLTLYPDYKKEQIEKLDNYFWRLYGKAQNLLNALDNHKEPLANQSIQEAPTSCRPEHTSKSIWRDVSELSVNLCESIFYRIGEEIHLGRVDGGNEEGASIYCSINDEFVDQYYIDEVCLLTDFINQQEQNIKRIEKLEQLIK